jgi:hypothetical protein
MVHSSCDLMVVLANLSLGTPRGGSCACLGVASRVVVLVFLHGHRSYTSSRVRLTRDLELYSGRCGGVPSALVFTVLGMAPQCPGWRHSTGDGRTGPEVIKGMRSVCLASWRHPGWTLNWWSYAFRERHCPLSRGVARRKDESWRHSATK